MKSKFIKLYFAVRASYWFVPTLMAIGAALLAAVTIWLDTSVDGHLLDGFAFLTANQPEGARAVLATIAGSMVTVAGVSFSMTMVAVSFAGGQFGPRLIGNFMRDRGNQLTLGTYIAGFVYCILVLRTVRNEASEGAAFVPHISILTGMGLGLCGIAVLIYFFHHVPETINISKITASSGRALGVQIRELFPARVGRGSEGVDGRRVAGPPPAPGEDGADELVCSGTGYVLSIDADTLLKIAREREMVVLLRYRPGDFVRAGDVVAEVLPAGRVDEVCRPALEQTLVLGVQRTPTQNVTYLVDVLVEILARALSPGVNDPFTAMNCLDWLGAGLMVAMQGEPPDPWRYDDKGVARLRAHPVTFEALASAVFDQTRPYVAHDRNAALHAIKVIGDVLLRCGDEHKRATLWRHAELLVNDARATLPHESSRQEVIERFEELRSAMSDENVRHRMLSSTSWLGGRG